MLAQRLGFEAAVLTSVGEDFLFDADFQGIEIEKVPAAATTVFENIYQDGNRTQFLHQKATDLLPRHLPSNWKNSPTVLLCPIADEVSFDFLNAFENATICTCPQGWMRQWDARQQVSFKPICNWGRLAEASIISMSEQDVRCDWDLIEHIGGMANLLVVTQGNQGATVFRRGARQHFPSFPTQEIDPTGAGDVFAAAFALKFSESADEALAAAFAHVAASLSVEGKGLAGISGRAAVEERFEKYRALFFK